MIQSLTYLFEEKFFFFVKLSLQHKLTLHAWIAKKTRILTTLSSFPIWEKGINAISMHIMDTLNIKLLTWVSLMDELFETVGG